MKKTFLTKAIICLFVSALLLVDALVFQMERSGAVWVFVCSFCIFIISAKHFHDFFTYRKRSRHRKIEDCRVV